VREALRPLKELRFNLDPEGSTVIYHHERENNLPFGRPILGGDRLAAAADVLTADAV